ncbi:MAG: HEAT repeat domain-containing protein [Deltaproteobacteria bacterium]|nr:HEAT repeat domain-containing protein [Deltaproteobacteria bacterium]
MNDKIIDSLKAFRAGDDEAAMTTLLEAEEELVPALVEAFGQETDPEVRAFLVTVAWERREEQSPAFIVEALNDPEEEVWQAALDGMVALASTEILDVLKSSRLQPRPDAAKTKRFQMCVEEAILYVEGLVQANFVPPAIKR